jgi:hypothetical protein
MTVETTAGSVSRSTYRDYFPVIVTIAVVLLLLLWLIFGHGWQRILAWDPVLLWFVILAILAGALLVIGRIGNEQWLGVLINPQFHMSLSRLQIVLWTLLVLSAYITIAIHRLSGNLAAMDANAIADCTKTLGRAPASAEDCGGGAINITLPPELLLAMGISAASFAGTSIIQSAKKGKTLDVGSKSDLIAAEEEKVKNTTDAVEAADQAMQKTRIIMEQATETARSGAPASDMVKAGAEKDYNDAVLAYKLAQVDLEKAKKDRDRAQAEKQKAEVESEGLLHKNASAAEAHFKDIFMGDEIGNVKLVDMSKVQMFFLTLVVVIVYGVAVAATLHDAGAMKNPMGYSFPRFSDTLDSLLAISHGTYLSVKTVDHSKTTQ